MKRYFLIGIALVFTGALNLFAQDFDRYEPMTCVGEIPKKLLTRSSVKFQIQKAKLEQNGSSRERKSKENFLLQSNFVMDELLLSGRVLFNDPVSAYITRVKDYLLREDPETAENIQIYLVKSPSVNAFATNDGSILVNMGLIAQLENEAQLGFILSHEIQHITEQHPINRYVETDKLKASTRLVNVRALEKFLLAKNQYSRELETEADKKGLELFKTSAYSLKEIDGVFDVLRYSYLPFDEVPWEKRFFESKNLQFPSTYRLDSLKPVSGREETDDALATHPNISKRRTMMEELLIELGDGGGEKFIFGQENFDLIRKICRYELSHEFLFGRRYEAAIYNSFLLLQDAPKSKYLKKIIAQSLYGLARYKNERNFYDVHVDYEEIEGESQQLFYFLEQFDKPQLNTFALQYCWRLHQDFPEDMEIEAMCEELFDDLFNDHKDTAESMSQEARKIPVDIPELEEEKDPEPDEEELSKYDKIKRDSENKVESGAEDYHTYAFVDLFEDPDFVNKYSEWMAADEDIEDAVYESPQMRRRKNKQQRRKGESLGIDKVVFVTPIYKKIDERKDIPVNYMASEKALAQYKDMIKETAGLVGLNYELLESHQFRSEEIDKFNDMVLMTNWMSDFFEGGEEDLRLVNIFKDEAMELVEKYGTPYFAWTGVVLLTQRRNLRSTLLMCVGCVILPALPIIIPVMIYRMLVPKQGMLYVNLVFNVEKNEIAMQEMRYVGLKDRSSVIKGALYDSMLQMKSKK